MRAGSNRNETPRTHTRCPNSSAQKHCCSVINSVINKLMKKKTILAQSYKAFVCHYVELNVLLVSEN